MKVLALFLALVALTPVVASAAPYDYYAAYHGGASHGRH